MAKITRRRINEEISIQAHKIIEKIKLEKDLNDKGEALEYIVLEFGKNQLCTNSP